MLPLADVEGGGFGFPPPLVPPLVPSCGLAPNGGPIGCDMVPADAPPGTNQTFADAAHPAGYRQSNTATFTRDVPVLPAGQRVQTLGASCAIDDTGAVHCQTQGNHGFILSAGHGVLW
ncbi:hypothetical protein A4G29_07920 [Mycobacterium kansasii]|nr:hypothetical protein A4G29_07920 [Mycobacterium kansasii]